MSKRELAEPAPPREVAGGQQALPASTATLPSGGSLTRAATQIWASNFMVLAAGLITGPLLAHALGASGRGRLAAIVVPLTLLGYLATGGLGSWVTVESARGEALGAVLGTTAVLSIGFGGVAALVTVAAGSALAHGDAGVFLFIAIGGVLMPLFLMINLLSCAAIGLSRWRLQSRSRMVPAYLSTIGTAGLFAAHGLTVSTAAGIILAGGYLAIIPLLPLIAEARPLRFDGPLSRRALSFGARAWIANLGALANARLDQLMMIPLVSSRQLGLYAVAVTYAGLPTVLSSAMGTIIGPRIAVGDRALVGRSLRLTMALTAFSAVWLAALAPIVIPVVFGHDFAEAVRIIWILLLSEVPLAGTVILTGAFTSLGRPGVAAFGQLIAATWTAVGLLLLLPTLQAFGAAVVSLSAYAAVLLFMLAGIQRYFDMSPLSLLTPRRSDLAWAARLMRSARARLILPRR